MIVYMTFHLIFASRYFRDTYFSGHFNFAFFLNREINMWRKFYVIRYITGGLFCFTMRFHDVDEYGEKMSELEKTGRWQLFSHENLTYFVKDDLPQEINGFIYKVLKN